MGVSVGVYFVVFFALVLLVLAIIFFMIKLFGFRKFNVENADFLINLGSKKDFNGHGLFKVDRVENREGGKVFSGLFPIDYKLFRGRIPEVQLKPISPKFVKTENLEALPISDYRNVYCVVPEVLDDFSGLDGTVLGDLLKSSRMSLEAEHSELEFYKSEWEKLNRLVAGIGEALQTKNLEQLKDLVGSFQGRGGVSPPVKPVQDNFEGF